MLPETGSVLGIDVGWSLKAASSGICRLDWDKTGLRWTVRHFTGQAETRRDVVASVAGAHYLLAVALDGPLRGDLEVIDKFRAAERLLTQGAISSRISQPGSSRSPVGRLLNHHTNEFARLVLARGQTADASHGHAIHKAALVEAYPTGFLGLMHPDPQKGLRQKRSDRYFEALAHDGALERLLAYHLPGRRIEQAFMSVSNHDDRAALVCAITALGVASGDYTAVGDDDGWIILPPRAFIADWALPIVDSWNQAPMPVLSR
jgi:hypothetical protein